MPDGPQHDVTVTLSELERRLVELERELQEVSAPVTPDIEAPPPAPEPGAPPAAESSPSAPAPTAPAVEALLAFRETLEATMRELLAAYDRLVAHLPAPPATEPSAPHAEHSGPVARPE